MHNRFMRTRRFLLIVVAALYFCSVTALAFVPTPAASRSAWFGPLLAFIPVGALLVLLLGPRRWWAAMGFAVLGAAWLEAGQSVWMSEGYADPMDVVWASVGAIIGAGFVLAVAAARGDSMRTHDFHRVVQQSGRKEIPQD